MTRRAKPVIHGRDHAPDGPDPMPATAGGGIQFDTHPQDGGFLWVHTTSTDPSSSRGINLMSDTPIQADGSAIQLYAETDDVEINSVNHDVTIIASRDVQATAGQDIIWQADRDSYLNADRDVEVAANRDARFIVNDASAGGNLILVNIPTSDPHVANAVWNNGGVLNISSG